MLKGQSILCFAPGPWDTIWRNRHHIMSRLASHNKVLYVEPIPYLRPTLQRLKEGGISAADILRPSLEWMQDGLFVYHPPVFLPISGKQPLSRLTGALRRRLLKSTMKKLGMKKPVLWLYRPEMNELVGQFGEKMSIYHVVDEYRAYQGVDDKLRHFLHQAELDLLNKADLVIVVSESLSRSRIVHNPRTFVIPNGVDYEGFQEAERKGEQPPEMQQISRPILGYIGLISARLNLTLLRRLVACNPDCSLVLLGSLDPSGVQEELKALLSLPQVHYLGRKHPKELPSYVLHFDVCLNPYKIEEEALNADPLKIYEYLASGKPTVSASIPSVERFSQLVRLASTEADFLQAIKDALAEKDPDLCSRRKSLAQDNSWAKRVEQISDLMESILTSASTPGKVCR